MYVYFFKDINKKKQMLNRIKVLCSGVYPNTNPCSWTHKDLRLNGVHSAVVMRKRNASRRTKMGGGEQPTANALT